MKLRSQKHCVSIQVAASATNRQHASRGCRCVAMGKGPCLFFKAVLLYWAVATAALTKKQLYLPAFSQHTLYIYASIIYKRRHSQSLNRTTSPLLHLSLSPSYLCRNALKVRRQRTHGEPCTRQTPGMMRCHVLLSLTPPQFAYVN